MKTDKQLIGFAMMLGAAVLLLVTITYLILTFFNPLPGLTPIVSLLVAAVYGVVGARLMRE